MVRFIVQYYSYLSNPSILWALENMIYQASHKSQILYFLEMVSSLLSQFSNSLTSCFFNILSGGLGGGLVCGSKYGGNISFLGKSSIDFDPS